MIQEMPHFIPEGGNVRTRNMRTFIIVYSHFSLAFLSLTDGIYTIKPGDRKIQTFCKFDEHGGGWTLVLTSATDNGWTRDNVKSRNTDSPSVTADFSILEMADNITNMKHFQVKTLQLQQRETNDCKIK